MKNASIFLITLAKIWQHVKKQKQQQQQGQGNDLVGNDGSASSTLRSRDSGLSTMSSTNTQPDPPPPTVPPPSVPPPPLPPLDQLRSQSLQESSLPPPAANRLRECAAAAYVNVFQGRENRASSSKLATFASSSVRPPLPSTSSSGVASLDSGFGGGAEGPPPATPHRSKRALR